MLIENAGGPASRSGAMGLLAAHAGSEVVRVEPFVDTDLALASLWADA